MKLQEAVALLRQFNEWGRSRELDRFPEIPDMHEVGNALDVVCDALESGIAPQPDVEPVALPFAILPEELADLRRFHECVTDGQGYGVPKARLKRLEELGLIRRVITNYYEHTIFGLSVLDGDFYTAPPTTKAIEEAAYRKAAEVIMGSSSLSVEQKNYWAGAILSFIDQPSALEEFGVKVAEDVRLKYEATIKNGDSYVSMDELVAIVQRVMEEK